MAVEDNPLYNEWAAAHDRYKEASERLTAAEKTGKQFLITLAKRDLDAAQEIYREIGDRV